MDLIDHGSEKPLEDDLKNILIACALMFLIIGCTSSDPLLLDVSISNDTPVTGQRVFVQVNTLSDNPPMTYQWSATSGELDVPETTSYSAYWTAPQTAGSYAITCTITDKEKKHLSHTFTVQVRERALESDLMGTGSVVLTITKETEYETGGIWASVKDSNLRFITSTSNIENTWAKNFYTMLGRSDPVTLAYTIWGVITPGRDIIELTTSTEKTLVCETCLACDTINALARDVNVLSTLWVGTNNRLNYYDSSSLTPTWKNYLYAQVNDLSEGPDYVYAATDSGIYKLDYTNSGPIYGGDTCAVLAKSNGTETEIWSVVKGAIQKNGNRLSVQPPVVICNLDSDISGNIWCGKYWWDGSKWQIVPGLESVNIIKTVASQEGLSYLLSDSGVLYRW